MTHFPDRRLEAAMRGFLAELLISDGKRDMAAEIAAPVCKAGPGGTVPDALNTLAVCK